VFVTALTTTVATIPFAATIVVLVVAAPITNPIWRFTVTVTFLFFWVAAFTVFAVLKLKLVSILATAVPIIPVASAIVIFIIASSISMESGSPAFTAILGTFFLGLRVSTSTLGAILKLFWVAALATAIATVPITTTIIIHVIASAIFLPFFAAALAVTFAFTLTYLLRRIQTLAFLTVGKLAFITAMATAITTIPVTTTVVVVIITSTILLELRGPAHLTALTVWLRLGRIQTFALFTILALPLVSTVATTIPTVPVTSTVVISIITTTITHPLLMKTIFGLFAGTIFLLFDLGIHAEALTAIFKLSLVTCDTTTVATIPVTSTVVVIIITSPVSLKINGAALLLTVAFFYTRIQAFAISAIQELSFIT